MFLINDVCIKAFVVITKKKKEKKKKSKRKKEKKKIPLSDSILILFLIHFISNDTLFLRIIKMQNEFIFIKKNKIIHNTIKLTFFFYNYLKIYNYK